MPHPGLPASASACCSCSGIVTATVTTTTPSNANAATMAIIVIDVFVVISLSALYGRKQRNFEALGAMVPDGHPLASACCCSGMVINVIAITPNNASAATMAIIAIDVDVIISLSPLYPRKHRPFEALNANADCGKPFSQPGAASACCSCRGIVTIVIATTPSNASAATIAITTNVVSFISKLKTRRYFLKIPAINHHLLDNLLSYIKKGS